MFNLKNLNVVRIVATEPERDKLLREGFELYEPEESADSKADPDLDALRERAKELGIENADRRGVKRLREEIAAIEADAELTALRIKAAGLGVEAVDKKDAETLRTEIAAKGSVSDGN